MLEPGLIAGPLGVVLAVLLFSRYQFTLDNYVVRLWLYHVIFGAMGLIFGIKYHAFRAT